MMHGSPPAQALNQAVPDPSPELLARASSLRRHAIDLAQCSDQQRQEALRAMADALEQQRQSILSANQEDLQAAEQEQLAQALLSRLKLDRTKHQARWGYCWHPPVGPAARSIGATPTAPGAG